MSGSRNSRSKSVGGPVFLVPALETLTNFHDMEVLNHTRSLWMDGQSDTMTGSQSRSAYSRRWFSRGSRNMTTSTRIHWYHSSSRGMACVPLTAQIGFCSSS